VLGINSSAVKKHEQRKKHCNNTFNEKKVKLYGRSGFTLDLSLLKFVEPVHHFSGKLIGDLYNGSCTAPCLLISGSR
jgi:hypothetical protein